MAITAEQQANIIKYTVGILGGSPGGYFDYMSAYLENAADQTAAITAVAAASLSDTNILAVLGDSYADDSTEAAFVTGFLTDLLPASIVAGENMAVAEALMLGLITDGATRAEAMVAAIDAVAAVESTDATWGAARLQLDNKISVATTYTVTNAGDSTDLSVLLGTISEVTEVAATVDTAVAALPAVVVPVDPATVGETYTLTTGTDSFVGTALNDTFTSASGTLAAADTILDSSSTDADVMNIETISATGVAARIQNVETINANGTYVSVGFDATTTSGTEDLNLSTSIVGGTANVIGASSINVANINAGTNVATLNVTSVAGGTRDTVIVDGGSATTVNIIGDANGIDKYDATIAAGSTLDVTIGGTLGEYTANVGATATLNVDTATAIKTFTVNTSADSTVTIVGAVTDVAANLASMVFAGSGDVTLDTDVAGVTAQAISNTGTGSLTVTVSDAVATKNLQDIQADIVQFDNTVAAVTVNAASTVNLTATSTVAVIQVDNLSSATAMTNTGQGTLNLKVSENQTKITTDDNVGTLLIEATPDTAADTDGTNGTEIVVTDLFTDAETTTVVVAGAADLNIGTVTEAADLVITATQMTGDLTIGATAGVADVTVVSGAGDDEISLDVDDTDTVIILAGAGDDTLTATDADSANGIATVSIYGEDGDDTISATVADTAGANVITLDGGAGNDTITGSADVDTIVGGTGNDIINGDAGADVISTGAGSDTVIIDAGDDGDVIADLTSGEDVLVLTGTSNDAAFDLSALTPATGAYLATTSHDFTLTGSTATDLTAMVRLGTQATATVAATTFTTAATADITAGDLNDHITTGATDVTIDAGAGDDMLLISATDSDVTGGAGADTFNVSAGTAIINDLGASDILITAAAATLTTVAVTEDFTATAATTTSEIATKVVLNLADDIDIDMTLATVTGAAGYTINTFATATTGSTIVGSRSADVVVGSEFADTITGGEGADTITGGTGADTIILTESVSAADEVTLVVQTVATMDTIVDARFDGSAGIDTLVTGIAQTTPTMEDLSANDYDTGITTLADAIDAAHVDFVTAVTTTEAGDAFYFVYDSNTYLVQESAASSTTFVDGTDLIIEITGYAGALDMADITA